MDLKDVKTADDVSALIADRNPGHIKVGVFDIDGVMRGKYMSRAKFLSALKKGFGFCDVVLGWDLNDQLYDNVSYTGWHTGYPDAPVRILPGSCRELPFEDNMLFFLGEFAEAAEAICPRGVLRRVLERARKMGFEPFAGFEYEFFVFEENAHSIREKRYRDLKPMAPVFSAIRSCATPSTTSSTGHCSILRSHGFFPGGAARRNRPGVLEGAITVDTALAAADKAALFKTFTKILAQRCGFLATFHGQVVAGLAGAERAYPHFTKGYRRSGGVP
jgi:glutamine synthetase